MSGQGNVTVREPRSGPALGVRDLGDFPPFLDNGVASIRTADGPIRREGLLHENLASVAQIGSRPDAWQKVVVWDPAGQRRTEKKKEATSEVQENVMQLASFL